MKLIIGLGNPGEKYAQNRHNVGYVVIDKLQILNSKPKNIIFAKTNVFMNESGKIVKKLLDKYKLNTDNLWIIHDDLDIRLGEYKIQKGKGPKVHKGLQSIEEELGTDDFWRVRVGVDNRDPENRIPGEEYVLQDFTTQETLKLEEVVKSLVNKLKNLWE